MTIEDAAGKLAMDLAAAKGTTKDYEIDAMYLQRAIIVGMEHFHPGKEVAIYRITGKRYTSHDYSEEYIKTVGSIAKAARHTGSPREKIRDIIKGKYGCRSHNGFTFKSA
ncbi:MAG: hypothetical protein IMZ64_06575 [Bacteroidetes bacterium]|nr:hypothetical protein [Bacteroidota bacterium]